MQTIAKRYLGFPISCFMFGVHYLVLTILCILFCGFCFVFTTLCFISKMASTSFTFEYSSKAFRLGIVWPCLPARPSVRQTFLVTPLLNANHRLTLFSFHDLDFYIWCHNFVVTILVFYCMYSSLCSLLCAEFGVNDFRILLLIERNSSPYSGPARPPACPSVRKHLL